MSFFDRKKAVDEVVRKMEEPKSLQNLSRVFKFNPYHDKTGRFTTSDSPAAVTHDRRAAAVEREKAQAHVLALKLYGHALKAEASISPLLKQVVPPSLLRGYKNRVKSIDSLARKIYTDAVDKKISLEHAASLVRDSVRYTVQATSAGYSHSVRRVLQGLRTKGFHVTGFRNTWAPEGTPAPAYQGINVNLSTPQGHAWELQFHTESSYHTKDALNHPYYEELRKLPDDKHLSAAGLKRKRELTESMMANQAKVKRPPGAAEIHWHH